MTDKKIIKYIKDKYAVYDFNKDNIELSVLLYKDGYKQGQKEILEQCSQYHGENKTCLIERVAKVAEENAELKAQIEKMKPYCKLLCKHYERTGYMGNDCNNGTCRNCDKWELAK